MQQTIDLVRPSPKNVSSEFSKEMHRFSPGDQIKQIENRDLFDSITTFDSEFI